MHPKNLHYLNNKRKFGESNTIEPVSDIKLIGAESRQIVYNMIALSMLFTFNLVQTIQQIIHSRHDDITSSFLTAGLTAIFGIALCFALLRYRRCESCRSDLESMIINTQANKNA